MLELGYLKEIVPLLASLGAVAIAILSFLFSLWSNKQRAKLELGLKVGSSQFDARIRATSDKAIFLRSENVKYRDCLQAGISSLQSLKDVISLVVNNNGSPSSFDSDTIRRRLLSANELITASHNNLLGVADNAVITPIHRIKGLATEVEFNIRNAIGKAEFLPSLDKGLCDKLLSVRAETSDVQAQLRDQILIITSHLMEETFEYVPRPLD